MMSLRKIIDTFEIFNESEMGENMIEFIKSKISDMQQYAKYINKKAIIIIKIESNEKLIQDILNEFSYAKNCYFIIIIDKEDIKDYKEKKKEKERIKKEKMKKQKEKMKKKLEIQNEEYKNELIKEFGEEKTNKYLGYIDMIKDYTNPNKNRNN